MSAGKVTSPTFCRLERPYKQCPKGTNLSLTAYIHCSYSPAPITMDFSYFLAALPLGVIVQCSILSLRLLLFLFDILVSYFYRYLVNRFYITLLVYKLEYIFSDFILTLLHMVVKLASILENDVILVPYLYEYLE